MNEIKDIELFAVGVWNGLQVKEENLNEIEKAYSKFQSVLQVPLKLGHNDEQEITDGKPALGWVTNVRKKGDKLLGDFVDLPDLVYKAIKNKLYNSLSIELYFDVDYKGENYPFVLTGVALLGADLPAVNTLKDLSKYIDDDAKKAVNSSKFAAFSYKPKPKEGNKVNEIEKLQAQLDAMQEKFSASADAQKELAAQNAKLEAQNAKFAAEKKQKEEDDAKAQFAAAKKEALEVFEELVKANELTPGQRDEFMSKVEDLATAKTAKFIAETLKSNVDPKKFSAGENMQSKDKGDDSGELAADQVLLQRINKSRAESGLSFSAAKAAVLKSDPKLARDYINLTKEI